MPVCPLSTLLEQARAGGYAVGYFEAWNLESLQAVVEAAEEEESPVILGFGCQTIDRRWMDEGGGIEYYAALARMAGETSRVPVSLIFNEANAVDEIARALDLGFNVVMLDAGHLSFEENVAVTRRIAELAHACGATAEGALGHLPDSPADASASTIEAGKTDVDQARRFVADTGVDALAVAIGNVHSMTDDTTPLDVGLLARLAQAVEVPLVLHGGSGLPDGEIGAAVAAGVSKINVGTVLKKAFLEGVRRALDSGALAAGPQAAMGAQRPGDLMWEGKEAMKAVVRQKMRVYGSAGRAPMTNDG